MRRLLALYTVIVALLFGTFSSLQEYQAQAGFKTLMGVGVPSVVSGGRPGGTTTFDPSNLGTDLTLSGGNLTVTATATSNFDFDVARTLASHSTGKYYSEYVVGGGAWPNTYSASGLCVTNATSSVNAKLGNDTNSCSYYNGGGVSGLQINNVNQGNSSLPAYVSGDTVDIAIDLGALLWWVRDNGGNWNGSGTANPATGTGGMSLSAMTGVGPWYAAVVIFLNLPNPTWTANFGGAAYTYAAPAGFCNW